MYYHIKDIRVVLEIRPSMTLIGDCFHKEKIATEKIRYNRPIGYISKLLIYLFFKSLSGLRKTLTIKDLTKKING